MLPLKVIYGFAETNDISVCDYTMPENGSMSIMTDSGDCYIGLDPAVQDGSAQERVHLCHELGHCITGSFYSRHTAIDCRQRHENTADKWAISKLIPQEDLEKAVSAGHSEVWDLAEIFGVTEDFIRKAVCWYRNGNVATCLYS